MEAACSSQTLVEFQRTTRRVISQTVELFKSWNEYHFLPIVYHLVCLAITRYLESSSFHSGDDILNFGLQHAPSACNLFTWHLHTAGICLGRLDWLSPRNLGFSLADFCERWCCAECLWFSLKCEIALIMQRNITSPLFLLEASPLMTLTRTQTKKSSFWVSACDFQNIHACRWKYKEDMSSFIFNVCILLREYNNNTNSTVNATIIC
jgi:hypothetical protein